jgi:hypothetical protein
LDEPVSDDPGGGDWRGFGRDYDSLAGSAVAWPAPGTYEEKKFTTEVTENAEGQGLGALSGRFLCDLCGGRMFSHIDPHPGGL